jgi:hypothetical protein
VPPMADVYSIRLFREPAFTGGPTVVFTAPEGYVTVVNTIGIVWGSIIVSGLDAWVQDDIGTKLVRVTPTLVEAASDVGGCQIFEGRWVLEAGDTLSCQTAEGTVDVFASGYALTLP